MPEVAQDPWEPVSEFDDDCEFAGPDFRLTLEDPTEAGEQARFAAEANALAVEAAATLATTSPISPADEFEPIPQRVRGGGALTIPLLCAGIAIIAACLLIPQADSNRRLAYERLKLQADLQAVEKQVETNDQFLKKIADDPNLAERLAQRQMKIVRQGNEVLNLKGDGVEDMSPFQLTAVPAPTALPPYQARGGMLAELCYNARSRLYLTGAGLMAMAAGLVMGFNSETRRSEPDSTPSA